ncbi:TetR/AcrR family transcriptional regulator [Pedobacter sp. WC2423]|uniref:TetR/AcrR family transcriptional regulator n=1 Tax=Pedobacter sp. WC2423 TaxID=3234142 RepID=UPI003466556A
MVLENAYKRKKEPEINKKMIIDMAIEIGATEDWHQVTFQAIADRTGLSKGGIIHHFRNKEELLDEMMRQGLDELTESVKQYKLDGNILEKDGSLAYLKFIISKSDDESYKKKMRVVLQAIMISEHYREMWDSWCRANILPPEGEINIHGLVTKLVADGIWYTENLGYGALTEKNKQDILDYLTPKL